MSQTAVHKRTGSPAAGIAVLIVVALAAFGWIKSHSSTHPSAAAAYCQSATVGHTTLLNTLGTLGQPLTRQIHNDALYVSYGRVSFAYSWDGFDGDSVLSAKTGC